MSHWKDFPIELSCCRHFQQPFLFWEFYFMWNYNIGRWEISLISYLFFPISLHKTCFAFIIHITLVLNSLSKKSKPNRYFWWAIHWACLNRANWIKVFCNGHHHRNRFLSSGVPEYIPRKLSYHSTMNATEKMLSGWRWYS